MNTQRIKFGFVQNQGQLQRVEEMVVAEIQRHVSGGGHGLRGDRSLNDVQ